MRKTNFFTIITKILVIILPFYVILSLFFEQIFHSNYIGLVFKEFLLILLFFSFIFEYFKIKKFPKLDFLDYLLFIFIIYGIGITIVNGGGIKSILFGGRYDFMFLLVMFIYKHSLDFLKIQKDELLRNFLFSGGIALFLGLVFKFSLGEEYLNNFGFVDYVGNRIYSGGVANFQGLEGTGIRRFQGIFDGPNPMAYFLIIYSFLFLYSQKKKNEFYVILTLIFLLWLIIITYSRSALLGIFTGFFALFLTDKNFWIHFKKFTIKYRKIVIIFSLFFILFSEIFIYSFRCTLKNIVLRNGSTSGHFERMEIGFNRFLEKPFGAGLAQAGPAFRNIYPEKQTKKDEVYYIPESRYIQILIEGGIIYFILFSGILILILKGLFSKSNILFAMFIAILTMNIFLHIFETTYLSILLFIFIGLFIKKE